jgi:hypothetical protein
VPVDPIVPFRAFACAMPNKPPPVRAPTGTQRQLLLLLLLLLSSRPVCMHALTAFNHEHPPLLSCPQPLAGRLPYAPKSTKHSGAAAAAAASAATKHKAQESSKHKGVDRAMDPTGVNHDCFGYIRAMTSACVLCMCS